MAADKGWKAHSKWNRTILARKAGNLLTYALAQGAAGALAPHLARSWNLFHASEIAYARAQDRLLKAGLAAEITRRGEIVLELTEEGTASLPPYLRPEVHWRYRWDGIWFLFAYDVPEPQREHRDIIRRALIQRRFGQFQKSLWIGPWDIRPWFDDLRQAAGILDFAMLLEARTVMGVSNERLVLQAWPWDRIASRHTDYLHAVGGILEAWEEDAPSEAEVREAVRSEAMAYVGAMEHDPLLPRKLWPPEYRGYQVYQLHLDFLRQASRLTRPA